MEGIQDVFSVYSQKDKRLVEAIRELSNLKGIGIWTAEMIPLFCMQQPDVFRATA